MSFAQIKGPLQSRIGRPVRFSAPKDVHAKGGPPGHGAIVDEVWADVTVNTSPPHSQPCVDGHECWGDHAFCAQLIRWSNDRLQSAWRIIADAVGKISGSMRAR
jgi:hypothetical protein